MGDRITYVGLDVHKEGIVVAVAEGGLRGEVREYGRIANTPAALDRLEGTAQTVRALSQTRPQRQAGQCRHRRDRPRAGRLHLGHCPARAAGGELIGTNA